MRFGDGFYVRLSSHCSADQAAVKFNKVRSLAEGRLCDNTALLFLLSLLGKAVSRARRSLCWILTNSLL